MHKSMVQWLECRSFDVLSGKHALIGKLALQDIFSPLSATFQKMVQ